MRFSRGIILRDGVGATPIRAAAHFVSIFLINAITLNAQIVPPGNATRPAPRVIAPEADRIIKLPPQDGTRATDLLDEAVGSALTAPPSMTRALALIGTAGSFTAFDARRGFKVMQTAVTAINEALAQRDASEPAHSNPGAVGEYEANELYGSSFEATFAALGRADFERAWSLAQQLAAKDISVLAQLAACRGGLDRL